MKKLVTFILVAYFMICQSIMCNAAELSFYGDDCYDIVDANTHEIEVFSEEVTNEICSWLIDSNGEHEFSLTREINTEDSDIGNVITVEISRTVAPTLTRANLESGTVNFALSGRYYYKGSDTTISNYGMHGSVDYTGYSLKNAQWETYHDVVTMYSDTYSPSSSGITESVTGGEKYIGKFKLRNTKTNTWCTDAEISITIKNDGAWSTIGNYNAININ